MPKSSELAHWVQQIRANNAKDVLEAIKVSKDFGLNSATKCIQEVQMLVYKSVKEKKPAEMSPKDIHDLVEKCLTVIESSGWEISGLHFLTFVYHITNYLLIKSQPDLAQSLFSYVNRWKKGVNKTGLNDSETQILNKIHHIFVIYLYNFELSDKEENNLSFYEKDCKYLFDLWKFTVEMEKGDSPNRFINSINIFGQLVTKCENSNVTIPGSFHLESLIDVISNCREIRSDVLSETDSFLELIKVFTVSSRYALSRENREELLLVLKCINISKEICSDDEYVKSLDICKKFIIFVGSTFGYNTEDACSLLEDCCHFFEEYSSGKAPSAVSRLMYVIIFKSFSRFSLIDNKDAFPHLFSLILKVCKMEAQLTVNCELEVGTTNKVKNDILRPMSLLEIPFYLLFYIPSSSRDIFINTFSIIKILNFLYFKLLRKVFEANGHMRAKYESYIINCTNVIKKNFFLNLYEQGLDLALDFIRNIINFSIDDFHELFSRFDVLNTLCSCCLKLKKTSVGLSVIVAWLCRDPDSAETCFDLWANLKLSTTNRKELWSTFSDLLEENKDNLIKEWNISSSALSSVDMPLMLMYEIKAYYKHTSLQGKVLMRAWTTLLSLNPPVLVAATGLMFILGFVNEENTELQEINKQRQTVTELLLKEQVGKDKDSFEIHLLLGNILFHETLQKIFSIRKKTELQLIRWKRNSLNMPLDEFGMVPGAVDSYDPIADSALAVSEQLPLLKELDLALSHIKAAFMKEENIDDKNLTYYFTLELTLANIKLIAQLYTLYCENRRAENTWRLLYTLSERFSNQDMCLCAVTSLLKLRCQVDPGWMDYAVEIADKRPENSPARQLFYIAKARNSIKELNLEDGMKQLERVGQQFRCKIAHSLYNLALGQSLMAPEASKHWKGKPSIPSVAFWHAFSSLYYIVKNGSWDGLVDRHSVEEAFLETLLFTGEYFCSLSMPRKAYYYLIEQIGLVQKICVPMRVAQLLVAMLWVDISVHKLDDCQLKLDNLLVILGLEKKRTPKEQLESRSPVPKVCSSPVYAYDDSISPMRFVSTRSEMSSCNGSPDLKRNVCSEIDFHPADCTCPPCCNPLFLCLTLDVIVLNASLCSLKKQYGQAIQHFEAGVKRIEQLDGKCDASLLEGRRATLYYHYAEVMLTLKHLERASTLNQTALNQLSNIGVAALSANMGSVSVAHLVFQKEQIAFSKIKSKIKESRRNKFPTKTAESQDVSNERTPEKCTAVPVRLFANSEKPVLNDISPPKLFVRRLQYDSDKDSSGKESDVCTETVSKRRTRKKDNLPNHVSQTSTNLSKNGASAQTVKKTRRQNLPSYVSSIPSSLFKETIPIAVDNKDVQKAKNCSVPSSLCKETIPIAVDNKDVQKAKNCSVGVKKKDMPKENSRIKVYTDDKVKQKTQLPNKTKLPTRKVQQKNNENQKPKD